MITVKNKELHMITAKTNELHMITAKTKELHIIAANHAPQTVNVCQINTNYT